MTMADARHAKKTNDELRAALLANNRIPVTKRKVPNTHSCGKTAAPAAFRDHLFANFTHAYLFPACGSVFKAGNSFIEHEQA
ncbi:MAG: hypothetical protein JWN85_3971 [Gammaproteobacteria bacterium]|nr:hypothetical protein [Gammaproteobacteria bacterium]